MKRWIGLGIAVLLAAVACGGSDSVDVLPVAGGGGSGSVDVCQQRAAASAAVAVSTSLTMRVPTAPVPVLGSDGRQHLVYELELVNATGGSILLQRLDVIGAQDGQVVASLDASALAGRLVVRDSAATAGTLGASQAGIVYLHLSFDSAAIPAGLEHTLQAAAPAAAQTGACVAPGAPTELVIDPPLQGAGYIAGDGCCDSVRHVRATLALNGRFFTAQRYAIDWEQLDAQGRIHVGDVNDPASYFIYGEPVHAVADGRVVAATDGMADSPIGSFPNLSLDEADGNHVVLDIGHGRYALYAHLKPNSVQVVTGAQVRRGQVLGLVGSSGRSSEPHLHFQITDGPSALASNGLPYRLSRFSGTRRGVSTAAFDQAIIDGQPIPTEAVAGGPSRAGTMPLDLDIVDLAQ